MARMQVCRKQLDEEVAALSRTTATTVSAADSLPTESSTVAAVGYSACQHNYWVEPLRAPAGLFHGSMFLVRRAHGIKAKTKNKTNSSDVIADAAPACTRCRSGIMVIYMLTLASRCTYWMHVESTANPMQMHYCPSQGTGTVTGGWLHR